MKTHVLQIWSEYFIPTLLSLKTFEIRENDCDYLVGDALILKEFNPDTNSFTGLNVKAKITYILNGSHFGLSDNMVAMSVKLDSELEAAFTLANTNGERAAKEYQQLCLW